MEDNIVFAPSTLSEPQSQNIEHCVDYNSTEIMQQRQQICFNCQYYVAEEMKCSECSCPVVMLSQFNFKTCPKGFW